MLRALALSLALGALAAGPASAAVVDAGALRATVDATPFRVSFAGTGRPDLLRTAAGGLGFRANGLEFRATRVTSARTVGGLYRATLATNDPLGRTMTVAISRIAPGVIAVRALAPSGADTVTVGFGAAAGQRFLGFGERSDAVVRSSGEVSNRVTEGPYQDTENAAIAAFVPPAGYNTRHDATYFPVPWVLSSRGYGVLLEGDAPSTFQLAQGKPWTAAIEGRSLGYRVYAGPTPARALGRFTADVGRQPHPAAPFFFGPWWQPKGDPGDNLATLRRAGAAGSLAQTYTHYLPCADHVKHGPAAERALTSRMHAAGLAVTTYFNPMICTGHPRYASAAARGLLTRNALGQPYQYRYTGSTQFLVSQFDFTAPGAGDFFGDLLSEAVGAGYDGWMEDFGEYTPDDGRAASGQDGRSMHNRYPLLYHGAARHFALARAGRPLARFNRSGWTGAARQSQIVWGGDPSTGFGFDGLESAVRNGLSMGLSGVSMWGSDIGGYFALSLPQTTEELERRWIQFGFASGVMRTQANGFSLGGGGRRAQITDPGVLPVWRRYARLRTQLYPHLEAAQKQYGRTGVPLMRQLALAYPGDARAVARDDEYLFGPDLLVAPVVRAGARTRSLYLPPGRWIDWWRSVDLDRSGAPRLKRPRLLAGGQTVAVPAPADQLPMFVRAGSVLPLLPADVETLSGYGKGTVHLGDRSRRRTLLAWPERRRSATARPAPAARVRSRLGRGGGWVLHVAQARRRRLDLQVALRRRPCSVTVKGKRVRFSWRRGVLRASVRLRGGPVLVRRRCVRG